MLTDSHRRIIEYLRFSITDLCNIRCHYCLPLDRGAAKRTPPPNLPEGALQTGESGSSWQEQETLLTFDEIERMIRILVPLGVKRVRLTGGEPLIRRNLPALLKRIHRISEIEELCLTTNGLFLSDLAFDLKEAGLDQINVHLDTLDADKFRKITRGGDIGSVFRGLTRAREAGFDPIKINCVLQKGINDNEISKLLRYCADEGFILRLIEMMPLGPGKELMKEHYISSQEILENLRETWRFIPSTLQFGKGPARYYWIPELKTHLGTITPISEPFCDSCNRIRISSDGRFQDCLAYTGEFSFRDWLRRGDIDDEIVAEKVRELLRFKKVGHEGFIQPAEVRTTCMSAIGG